jgi:tRNA(Ile)-lysidine synthetase-like protein
MCEQIRFRKELLPSTGNYILMLSGGVDSVAVGSFLAGGAYSGNMVAYHYNHKLRPQNDVMEDKVRWFCEAHEIPLYTRSNSGGLDLSKEADARKHRFAGLREVIGELDNFSGVVCTAHHLDDCVESYLMRAFRGTLGGEIIPSSTGFKGFSIVHPFLLTPKRVFRSWVMDKGLWHYVEEDESNTDTGPTRNWIRNDLRLRIEERYPGLEKVVKKMLEEQE